MAKWGGHINNLVEVAIVAVFGFGIALYLGSTLLGALVVGSAAWNGVNAILGGFTGAIVSVFVPVIAILFIIFLYMVVKGAGLLGHKQ